MLFDMNFIDIILVFSFIFISCRKLSSIFKVVTCFLRCLLLRGRWKIMYTIYEVPKNFYFRMTPWLLDWMLNSKNEMISAKENFTFISKINLTLEWVIWRQINKILMLREKNVGTNCNSHKNCHGILSDKKKRTLFVYLLKNSKYDNLVWKCCRGWPQLTVRIPR
jgi:hypothetical protein